LSRLCRRANGARFAITISNRDAVRSLKRKRSSFEPVMSSTKSTRYTLMYSSMSPCRLWSIENMMIIRVLCLITGSPKFMTTYSRSSIPRGISSSFCSWISLRNVFVGKTSSSKTRTQHEQRCGSRLAFLRPRSRSATKKSRVGSQVSLSMRWHLITFSFSPAANSRLPEAALYFWPAFAQPSRVSQ